MKFESTFNIGDVAYTFVNGIKYPQAVTIGQIRIEHTDSKGDSSYSFGDNYKHQKGYVEQYMCDETGVGSGTVYTLGEHIFATSEECAAANAERIKEIEGREAEQKKRNREEKLRREASLRAQLEEIERIKAEGV